MHEYISNTYYESDGRKVLSPLKLSFIAIVIYVVLCSFSIIFVNIFNDQTFALLKSSDYSNATRVQDNVYSKLDTDSNGFVVYDDRTIKYKNGNLYSWVAFDWSSTLQERNERIYCKDDGF
jgi:hypothetical protein